MWFEKNGRVFVSMPGVPHEMQGIMTDTILDKLRRHFKTPVIYHKMIKTAGIGESYLAEKIEAWEDNLPQHIRLAYLPSFGQVRLRLTATGENLDVLKSEVQAQIDQLATIVPNYIYGYDDDTLEEIIGKLLVVKGLTIAIAESCTVGFVTHSIGKVPGCSRYLRGSITPYHNDAKIHQLGVNKEAIENFGAVSEQTVIEMAQNVRTLFTTDIGVASTGIAGPDGGTDEKPVGTVWIAFANGEQTVTKKLQLGGDRELNIRLTALNILILLRQNLIKES
jgi:nicotinamide-nucleotide amidase